MVKNSRKVKRIIENVAGFFLNHLNQHNIPATLNYKPPLEIPTLSTGFRPLDKALEIGGLPYGKITELMSSTSSMDGATSISARIASKVQRKQQIVTIIDMGHLFDPWRAGRAGLVAPHLLLTRPDTVFEALTTLESAARYQEGLIIVVMGIVTELLGHAGADLRKTLLSRVRTIVNQSNHAFLFVTAPKKNDPFDPDNYPAGFPLAELADMRLWIQDENWSYKDGFPFGYKANLTVIKNRFAVAGKGATISLKFVRIEPAGE